jgi:hypothetical protein
MARRTVQVGISLPPASSLPDGALAASPQSNYSDANCRDPPMFGRALRRIAFIPERAAVDGLSPPQRRAPLC